MSMSDDKDKVDLDQVDLDSISDEEALLACRAYLQRKNRLGSWTESKRRKRQAAQASARGNSFSHSSVGFFWEDPDELVYLKGNPRLNDTLNDVEELQMDDLNESDMEQEFEQQQDEEMNMFGDEFTSFPLFKPDESKRRSDAAKQKWKDPQWKAMWYEKRWGARQGQISKELEKQKKFDNRIQSVPPHILTSPELASMSSDEISEAIHTYVLANKKRSESLRKRAKKRQRERNQDTVVQEVGEKKEPRDTLFALSEKNMREAQRKRSERAAKIYQTRLENESQRSSSRMPIKRPTQIPGEETPHAAVIRIRAALDANRLPSVKDVELVIPPLKLGHRKKLLRRILSEHYGLRGKCVPEDLSKEDSPLTFATQCPVEKLGKFVVYKMKQRETNK